MYACKTKSIRKCRLSSSHLRTERIINGYVIGNDVRVDIWNFNQVFFFLLQFRLTSLNDEYRRNWTMIFRTDIRFVVMIIYFWRSPINTCRHKINIWRMLAMLCIHMNVIYVSKGKAELGLDIVFYKYSYVWRFYS